MTAALLLVFVGFWMHDLHFACNCNGFEAGWMFFIVFSMLGGIFTKNQRKCDHPGFNIGELGLGVHHLMQVQNFQF